MHCPSCGAENSEDSTFCSLCLKSFGFDNPEYTSSHKRSDGIMSEYPSSFKQPTPEPAEKGSEQKAEPVDIGRYGQRTGEQYQQGLPPVSSPPVDVGRYGSRDEGQGPVQPDAEYTSPGDFSQQKERRRKRHLFKRSR